MTLFVCQIGDDLYGEFPGPDGVLTLTAVPVADLDTLRRVVEAPTNTLGTPGAWVTHPPGGDRSLPALADWARALPR